MTQLNRPITQPSATDAWMECRSFRLHDRLRKAGLRPTRQRLSLGQLLFGSRFRHVTAEALFDEAVRAQLQVSLATVYNTLNQFTEAGLLRRLAPAGGKTYFDTNTTKHHHYVVEGADEIHDLPALLPGSISADILSALPNDMEITDFELLITIWKKRGVRRLNGGAPANSAIVRFTKRDGGSSSAPTTQATIKKIAD